MSKKKDLFVNNQSMPCYTLFNSSEPDTAIGREINPVATGAYRLDICNWPEYLCLPIWVAKDGMWVKWKDITGDGCVVLTGPDCYYIDFSVFKNLCLEVPAIVTRKSIKPEDIQKEVCNMPEKNVNHHHHDHHGHGDHDDCHDHDHGHHDHEVIHKHVYEYPKSITATTGCAYPKDPVDGAYHIGGGDQTNVIEVYKAGEWSLAADLVPGQRVRILEDGNSHYTEYEVCVEDGVVTLNDVTYPGIVSIGGVEANQTFGSRNFSLCPLDAAELGEHTKLLVQSCPPKPECTCEAKGCECDCPPQDGPAETTTPKDLLVYGLQQCCILEDDYLKTRTGDDCLEPKVPYYIEDKSAAGDGLATCEGWYLPKDPCKGSLDDLIPRASNFDLDCFVWNSETCQFEIHPDFICEKAPPTNEGENNEGSLSPEVKFLVCSEGKAELGTAKEVDGVPHNSPVLSYVGGELVYGPLIESEECNIQDLGYTDGARVINTQGYTVTNLQNDPLLYTGIQNQKGGVTYDTATYTYTVAKAGVYALNAGTWSNIGTATGVRDGQLFVTITGPGGFARTERIARINARSGPESYTRTGMAGSLVVPILAGSTVVFYPVYETVGGVGTVIIGTNPDAGYTSVIATHPIC